jgi:hypothetical protein
MAPVDTSVAFAAREGELCRVVGYVTTRDPGPNEVLFTLGLPNSFNGRYIYLGVGGAAGNLPVLRPELIAKGFAVSGSDGGTGAKHTADFSFKSNPGKLADFRGRGVHVVAAATQQITRAYYGQPQIHRYISGCSGGGSMGLVNALRFANQDFDGFVVGATPGTTNSEEPLIDSLVTWVEKNQPPDTVIANKVTPAKGLERTFRLCAEPARAFLKKEGGDPAKAENWECRSPGNSHQLDSSNPATERRS